MLEFQYEFYFPELLTEAGKEASTENESEEDKENTDKLSQGRQVPLI